jgi:GNAT superfamily N-acetyltransferase
VETGVDESTLRVAGMGSERFEDIVGTLCDAFCDYPVMRYVLRDAADDYDARLSALIGYFTHGRTSREWPVLGVLERDRLLAVASSNPPRPAPPSPSLQEVYRRLCEELGGDAIARLDAFGAAAEPLLPLEPHYYLGMLGVRREAQGRGCARLLLDALHEMSAQDPASAGVVLTTETPTNLTLYEHFGYRVLGRIRVEELQSWTLFRPDEA